MDFCKNLTVYVKKANVIDIKIVAKIIKVKKMLLEYR